MFPITSLKFRSTSFLRDYPPHKERTTLWVILYKAAWTTTLSQTIHAPEKRQRPDVPSESNKNVRIISVNNIPVVDIVLGLRVSDNKAARKFSDIYIAANLSLLHWVHSFSS